MKAKKIFYSVLLIAATLVLAASLALQFLLPAAQNGFSGGRGGFDPSAGFPSDAGFTPDGKFDPQTMGGGRAMGEGGSVDEDGGNSREQMRQRFAGGGEGEMPSDMDGRSFPDFEGMDDASMPSGDGSDFSAMGSRDFSGGRSRNALMSALYTLRPYAIPAAVVSALVDMLCIAMLISISRKQKAQLAQAAVAEAAAAEAEPETRGRKPAKKGKGYTGWILLLLFTAALAAIPYLGEETAEPENTASILSAAVETRDVDITLSGSGILAEQEALEVDLPAGVEVTRAYVSNGDYVKTGDPLVKVESLSVQKTISQVQDAIDYLDEKIADAMNENLDGVVSSQVSGVVKAVYLAAGDTVEDVMREYGCLMVISLDGRLSVGLSGVSGVTVSQTVTVTLEDGTELEGRVYSAVDGNVVVTVSDTQAQMADTVTVSTTDGRELGAGTLEVHSPLKVTAYSGRVRSVSAKLDQKVNSGSALFYLEDVGSFSQDELLLAQRQAYESTLQELFALYQEPVIYAGCDGIVSGISDDLVKLSVSEGTYTLKFLSNVVAAEDTELPSEAPSEEPSDPQTPDLSAYDGLSGVIRGYSEDNLYEVFFFDLEETASVSIAAFMQGSGFLQITPEEAVGRQIIYYFDRQSGLGYAVMTPSTQPDEDVPGSESTEPTEDVSRPQMPSGGVSFGGGGGMSGGQIGVDEAAALYDLQRTTVLAITPQETVSVEITVDELDILSFQIGQDALVTLDAVPSVAFYGKVTEIGAEGTNSGGNTKFTVTVSMERTGQMLAGMNASAVITVDKKEQVLTIPTAALVEDGVQTVVYTGYDEKSGSLTGPVAVECGVSDGENTEILSGISADAAVWYSYYDTYHVSTASGGSNGANMGSNNIFSSLTSSITGTSRGSRGSRGSR